MREIVQLAEQIADLQRRVAALSRRGVVETVDPAAGTVRLRFGDGPDGPYLSAPIPYMQTAGALRAHIPPTPGQQMIAVSPGGDIRGAAAMPLGFSDDTPSPSSAGDQNVIAFGDVTITLAGDGLIIAAGGVTVTINASGLSVTGGDFAASGGAFTHDGKNVGKDHTHSGITSGPDVSGPPT